MNKSKKIELIQGVLSGRLPLAVLYGSTFWEVATTDRKGKKETQYRMNGKPTTKEAIAKAEKAGALIWRETKTY